MCRRLFFLVSLILLLGIAGTTSAVEIKVDFGGGGTLDGSWTQWNAHSGNLTVDTVQLTLANSGQPNGPNIRTGIGDALTKETLGSDDPGAGGVYTLTITNLPAGSYNLDTYFNNPTSFDPPWNSGGQQEVWVNGTMQAGPSPASYQETSANALVLSVSFTSSGTSDVVTIDWKNSALPSNWICGFELVLTSPMLRFATAKSGDFEPVSPADLEVVVLNADESQTYTVQYAVNGGTATGGGVDYTLAPGTLTFDPCETSKTISIDIIDDGLDEDDETIIVELSNPTGPNAVLGNITQHTYTIRDLRPTVGFETDHSINSEDDGLVSIPVSLSFPAPNTVTVAYAVTGGTATGGGVDYTLEPGTLTFDPGQTSKPISIAVVDDGVDEANETVVITLSDIVGGKPASITEHTLTIVDPITLDLKVDLALENPLDSGIPRPDTLKDGWVPFCPVGLGDMYMHDWRGIRDLGGTGIDVSMTAGREGTNGIKCYDMCMDNKAGGWPPTGAPVGGPIANTWYASVDRVSFPQSCVLLALYDVPVGTYVLVSYHNLWEPQSDNSRECTKNGYAHLPMPKVHVWSFADANDWGQTMCLSYPQYCGQFYDGLNKIKGFAGSPPYSTNVVAIEEDYDVMPSATTNDDEVTTSLVRFWTDGSPVIIMYESGDCETTQYIGCRGVLNAFRLVTFDEAARAFDPSPGDAAKSVHPESFLQWQPGLEAALHDVYFGSDYDAVRDANTTVTLDVYIARQDACEYDPNFSLELGQTYYWRVDEVNDGNIWQGYVWSFTVDLGKAGNPDPCNGAIGVAPDANLAWAPGVVAGSHDVYFGTDYYTIKDANASSPQYKGNQSLDVNSFDPPSLLDLGKTYYWRIDEINPGYADSKGDVWSFTIQQYTAVDDMESYCEGGGCGNKIYDTWLDNWSNDTGAIIDLGTASEPIHGGSQSMRFDYDNDYEFALYYYSETARTFADACDWAALGAKVLSLYFYGDPGNHATSTEQMYVGLEDISGPTSYAEARYGDSAEDMNDIKQAEWHQWHLALSDFNDGGVNLGAVKKIYIGFGDRFDPVAGYWGTVYFDDIRVYSRKCILPAPYGDLSGDCIVAYRDLDIMAEQWLYTGSVVADLHVDDIVNFKDLAILAEDWLKDKLWPPEE